MATHKNTVDPDTLRKRYGYKLATNFVGLFVNVVTSVVVPRSLGPVAFGNFSFLTSFFNQVVNFVQMGSTQAFFTKLSARQDDAKLLTFYSRFVLFVFLSVIGLAAVVWGVGAESLLWPGQNWPFILAALGYALILFLADVVGRVIDAYALTVAGELARLAQKLVSLCLLLLMVALGILDLKGYFSYQIFSLVLLVALWWRVLIKRSIRLIWGSFTIDDMRSYLKEFYEYCNPLILLSILSLVFEVFDRWFLQKYGGSAQQGFYSLSLQIASVCFLFSGAMTPLITREFSVAHGQNDTKKMAALFTRYIPMLYAIAAYISCFVALHVDTIVHFTGGKTYTAANKSIFIMAFYPLHQTYGQIGNSLFFATGRTQVYRNIVIFLMVTGFPVTFFLVAPSNMMGLDAGSLGLAIKMVMMQIVGVNLALWYNCRQLSLSYGQLLWHQIYTVALFCVFAVVAKAISSGDSIGAFIAAGLIYTFLVAMMGYVMPSLFAVSRGDITNLLARFKNSGIFTHFRKNGK